MGTHLVGKVTDFKEFESRVIEVDGKSIGVVKCGGEYYAYRNKCPHQGGPACEGDVRRSVVGVVDEKGNYRDEVSKDGFSIVCPWHGVEYDVKTGVCKTDRTIKLRPYEVIVDGEEVRIRV